MLLIIIFQVSTSQALSTSSENVKKQKLFAKCKNNNGKVAIKYTPHKHVYFICEFEGNRQCELTSLAHGWCKVGGVKVTGYDTKAQVFCAIQGGHVLAIPNAKCTLPNGKSYQAESYFNSL